MSSNIDRSIECHLIRVVVIGFAPASLDIYLSSGPCKRFTTSPRQGPLPHITQHHAAGTPERGA